MFCKRKMKIIHSPHALRPVPTTPTVLPTTSKPTSPDGVKSPSRTRAYALCRLRFRHIKRATACSATALGL